jgi:voltage-gated potassium channel
VIFFLVRAFRSGHRARIAILLAVAVACMLVGAALFAATQHLSFGTGVYWAITTATTVGYGDVTPKTDAGRIIASGVMLTTIPLLASVFALATGGYITEGIRRVLSMHSPFPDRPYRLVLGMNDMVPEILNQLARAGIAVVLVADVDTATVPEKVHHLRADPTQESALRRARPTEAEQALITGQSDGDVLVTSVLVRRMAPDLRVAALVSSPSVREALVDLGVQQAMSAHDLVASTLAKTLEAPHAADMVAQLVESGSHRLAEVQAETEGAVGKSLSAVRDERAGLVLGLVHGGRFSLGLAEDPVIEAGDSLLVAEATRSANDAPASSRRRGG